MLRRPVGFALSLIAAAVLAAEAPKEKAKEEPKEAPRPSTHTVKPETFRIETQLKGVVAGDPVEIKVDAYPGMKFQGQVESISPSTGAQFSLLPPENATGNFTKVVQRVPVRIRLAGGDPRVDLRPGMSCKVKIEKGEKRPVKIHVEMSNSAGIFQLDNLLGEKLKHSGIAEHVEVIGEVAAEEQKIIQRYTLD